MMHLWTLWRRRLLRNMACCCVLVLGTLGSSCVQAAYSCFVGLNGAQVFYGVYNSASNLNMPVGLIVYCSRALTDPSTYSYAVTLDDGATTGTRRVYRHGGSNVASDYLNHNISRTGYGGAIWSTGANAITGTLRFDTGGYLATDNPSIYFQVPAGQTGKAAGIYDDVLTMSMRQGSASGTVVATGAMTPTVSVGSVCFVGNFGTGNYAAPNTINPSTLVFDYTSFSSTAVSKSMKFTVDCTKGTPYTLSLSPTSGTLLGLPYSLSLTMTSSTGTGGAQNVWVNGTIAANQAGTCALASCTATQPTTVTISY